MSKYIPPGARKAMENSNVESARQSGSISSQGSSNHRGSNMPLQSSDKPYRGEEQTRIYTKQATYDKAPMPCDAPQDVPEKRWGPAEKFEKHSTATNKPWISTTEQAAPIENKLRVVEIDSLVLIKVLKHCKDNYPTAVNGQLLGMDTGDKLEVTNCFPLPQKADIYNSVTKKYDKDVDERVDEEFDIYQDKLAELMHDLNVDCFTVGWYQTLSFGDLKNKDNIDSLVLYQELVDKAIMLGFDPLLNAMGKMAFKAFRVSDEFLQKYHEAEEDVGLYNEMRAKDILVEVPIVIRNPLLVEAYLTEWASADTYQNLTDFDALELDQNNYLEKNLNFLSDCLEDLGSEQDKLHRYHRDYLRQQQSQKQIIERRRAENEQRSLKGEPLLPMDFDGPVFKKIDTPSQIYTLLMSNQTAMQCKDISETSNENLGKMFLLNRSSINNVKP